MTWPIDKLTLVNEALTLTGDNLVNVADDGSDEWNVASSAYELALPYAIEGRNWSFGTHVVALNSAGTPADDQFTDAYDKPPDLLHLIWVRLADQPVVYSILDNQIALSAGGQAVTIKYVRAPDVTKVTPTFAMGLRVFVMSGIYRGLQGDNAEADRMWQMGEQFMQQAATRSAQEGQKRAGYNSRIAAARRVRRPWPPVPTGWGGTGIPG